MRRSRERNSGRLTGSALKLAVLRRCFGGGRGGPRLWRIATWAGLAAVFGLSLLPGDQDVDVDFAEDAHHFAAYLVLGFAAATGYPAKRLTWIVALGTVAGGLELLQQFSPGRAPSWHDFVSGVAGAAVGATAAWAVGRVFMHEAGRSGSDGRA